MSFSRILPLILLSVLTATPTHADGFPRSDNPRGTEISVFSPASNFQFDTTWGFNDTTFAPLLHQHEQNQFGRVTGWIATGDSHQHVYWSSASSTYRDEAGANASALDCLAELRAQAYTDTSIAGVGALSWRRGSLHVLFFVDQHGTTEVEMGTLWTGHRQAMAVRYLRKQIADVLAP